MRLSRALGLAVCCVVFLGAGTAFGELVTNGDFEMGGVGFGTQYATPFGGNTVAPTELTLSSMASAWNPAFADPAGSTGLFLVANGATDPFDRAWFTTIAVTAGMEYKVSFDATTLSGSTSPAKLGFYAVLNPADPIAATNVATSDLSVAPFDTWKTKTGTFKATHTGGISVFISDLTTSVAGNDFGIDNISVTAVPEPSSLALLGIGSLVGLGVYTRRRRRSA